MGDTLEDHIDPVDAFTVTLERDPLLRATIVAVATFDRAPDWDVLVDRIDRATRLVPRFRQKLVTVPWGLAPPRWIVDPDFDLSLHLHRVRVHRGGGMPAVLQLARSAGLTSFDHDRPLWEFTLVEGLPSKRAALIMKLHHALTDGVGGIEIAAHVVDLEREPASPGPMPAAPVARDHDVVDLLTDTIGYHLRRAADAGGEIRRAIPHTLRHGIARPVETVTDGVNTAPRDRTLRAPRDRHELAGDDRAPTAARLLLVRRGLRRPLRSGAPDGLDAQRRLPRRHRRRHAALPRTPPGAGRPPPGEHAGQRPQGG